MPRRHASLTVALFAALSASFFGFFVQTASAAIEISPLKFELNEDPGQTVSRTIRLRNTGTGAETLYSSAEDFFAKDDTAAPTFIPPSEQTSENYSLARWIRIPETNITLAPGETREIPFTISIPKTAEPGGHYGAVLFSSDKPVGQQIASVTRYGVLVLVEASGDLRISGDLRSFKVGVADSGSTTLSYPDRFSSFPVTFESTFTNSGNTHLMPRGKIEIVDEKGQTLKNIGKEATMNQAGAYTGDKMVDYIPVNDAAGNVLPGTIRRFLSPWEGFAYQETDQASGNKIVKFRTLEEYYADKAESERKFLQFWETVHSREVTKKFTANLTLAYTGKDGQSKDFHQSKDFVVTYSERYVDYNYLVIGLAVLAVLGLLGYVFVYVPRSRERLKRELLEALERERANRS